MPHEPEKMGVDHRRDGAADGVDRPWLVSSDVAVLADRDQRLRTVRASMRLRVFFDPRRENALRTEQIISPWGDCVLSFGSVGLLSLAFTRVDSGSLPRLPLHPLFAGAIKDLTLQLQGSAFQLAVWRALLDVPWGQTRTYKELAQAIGRPGAARAVGQAVGQNPLAWIIPCHRILPAGGGLGGFRWGATLKKRLLAAEGAYRLGDERRPPDGCS